MRRVLSLVITVLFAVQLLLLSASGQVYPEQTVSDGLWRFVVDDAVTYPGARALSAHKGLLSQRNLLYCCITGT